MLIETSIVKEVKSYVIKLLTEQLSEDMTYHSINHTRDVVNSANEIADNQDFSPAELEILNISAWFHDTGYTQDKENHEVKSAEIARSYLEKIAYPEAQLKLVEACILSTQMPQSPRNALEKTLCDADLMHLADKDYFIKADLLHQEIENTKLCKIPEKEWLKMNQEFLDSHCFFTEYAQKKYESAVKDNLRKVQERLKSWQKTKK